MTESAPEPAPESAPRSSVPSSSVPSSSVPSSRVPESAPLSFRGGYQASHAKEEKLLGKYTEVRRQAINAALQRYMQWDKPRPRTLPEAMSYAVLSDGKRLRPVLCATGAEICGGTLSGVMPTACALELIHAFSLIHDDLPALDDDALRRGRPSCHVKFGEGVAILAGDALFAKAFDLLAEQRKFSSPDRVLDVLQIINEAVGVDGMAGGQVEDILAERRQGDLETLEYVHSRKSGSLIRASLVSGAILAGGGDEEIEKLGIFGEAIGLAFQIVDDILGETSDPPSLGKPVKNDEERGKLTYPRLLGIERAHAIAEEKLREALSALRGMGAVADPLRWIATYVLARSR